MVADVNNIPPAAPSVGDEWFDIGTTGELYVWDGQQWVSASGSSDNLYQDITTDQVLTNPEIIFRDANTDNIPDLKNQLEVNRYLVSEIEAIEDYDDTQIKADLATETQDRIAGDAALDLRIDAVEDSITGDGGFVDAPNDTKLYGRQSEAWAEVVIPSTAWDDITSKPTEFPPSAHDHIIDNVTGLQDALNDKAGTDHDQPWGSITDVPTEFPPSAHDHIIDNVTGLQDALNDKSDVGHKHVIADVTGLQDALDNAGGVDYTLPVVLRSGAAQLPLTVDGTKLAVMTRGGELELPLAA